MKVLLIFICIIQNVADIKGSPLENSGEKCWGKCNGQDGKCDWCGTKGWCCRKNKIANGCDGTFGGNGVHHECHLHSGMLESLARQVFHVYKVPHKYMGEFLKIGVAFK